MKTACVHASAPVPPRRLRLLAIAAAIWSALLLVHALVSPATGQAAWTPGSLDTRWGGGDGRVVVAPTGITGFRPMEHLADSVGRRYVAGECSVTRVCVVRLTASGTIDRSWGGGDGVFTHALGATVWSGITDLEWDSGGRLLFAGYRNAGASDAMLVGRITASGTGLDTTFAGGVGYAAVDGSGSDRAYDVHRLSSGRVLMAGYSDAGGATGEDWIVVRLTSAGLVDTSFGGGTGFVVDERSGSGAAYGMDVDAAGRVVMTGDTANDRLAVWRVTASGAGDTTFSGDGYVEFRPMGSVVHRAYAVAVDDRNRPVIAGNHDSGSTSRPLIARVRADGRSLDSTFGGGDGFAAPATGTVVTARELLQLEDGRYVVAGAWNLLPGSSQMFLARYSSDGVIDTSFGSSGITKYTIGAAPWMGKVAELSDGGLQFVGYDRVAAGGFMARVKGDRADLRARISKPRRRLVRGTRNTVVIAVANRGGQSAREVVVTGTVPRGIRLRKVRAPSGLTCSRSGRTFTCRGDIMAAGVTRRIRLVVTVRSSARRRVRFTARARATTADPATGNNTASKRLRTR